MELLGITSNDPECPTDWQGRTVNTQNWGAGVGSNLFRRKTHVFMFGSFYLPGSATIAQTHGWSQQPLSVHKLALAANVRSAGDLYAPRGDYRRVHDGNVLRWVKQLAMRGKARTVDDGGKCGAMKLFLTMELEMLVPNMHRLFPGSLMPEPAKPPAYLAKEPLQGRQALLRLAMSSKRSFISAEEFRADTGIQTSKLGREYAALEETLMPLGWSLKSAAEIGKAGRMKFFVNDDRYLKERLLAV